MLKLGNLKLSKADNILVLISLDIESVEVSHTSESIEQTVAEMLVIEEGLTCLFVDDGGVVVDARALRELLVISSEQ